MNYIVSPRVYPLPPLRRIHTIIPRRVTYKDTLRYGSVSVETVPMFQFGTVPRTVSSLQELKKESRNGLGDCNQCYHLGKVSLPELGQCPVELFELLTRDNA